VAWPLTSAHWGTYRVEMSEGKPVALHGFEGDSNPSPIGEAMLETLHGGNRVGRPVVRRGFLEQGGKGDRSLRGRDSFVEVDWDEALDLVAAELLRVRSDFGNASIYAGSYGWSSAGRFHHAQSQLRRFMNLFGGCTTAKDTYSYAAGEVILPHVAGSMPQLLQEHTSWQSVIESGSLVVSFGGMAMRNAQVNAGGTGDHSQPDDMRKAKDAGVEFVSISPCVNDTLAELDATWIPVRPNSDMALMLALAYTLVRDGLHDEAFLQRYCTGFDRFLPYLTGAVDGQPKDPKWAENLTGIPAATIVELAGKMASRPTLINASWSLTRQHNGEQTYWMLIVLAAILGGIGQPGRGFALGLATVNGVGNHRQSLPWAALPTGQNPTDSFIPVSRIADMLLNPGASFDYNGGQYKYPDARLVYWAGGNPFHHHQDLNRLRQAWQKIETVVVHEPFWTATARHADIVLPTTVGLERNDLSCSSRDSFLFASSQVSKPCLSSRNDHDIFAALARRLPPGSSSDPNFEEAFTNGLGEEAWLRELYRQSADRGREAGIELPDYDAFMKTGVIRLDPPARPKVMLEAFRNDPEAAPLSTPSGRIEIFSETIAGFDEQKMTGHPVWTEPGEWLGSPLTEEFPLHLVTHQPDRKLHSQLDHSSYSRAGKIRGREPCRLNPLDAGRRDIVDGDVVRLFNNRGACLAGAVLDKGVREGVVMMATGAWYDPDLEKDSGCCKHGNPNTLTADMPTSALAQGPAALSCLVEIERFLDTLPDVTAFSPPEITGSRK
jgi:biotin/methionine sulfoxide reductase